MRSELNIPHKASRVLNLVLLAFLLILLRTWYLGFVQGEYHKQEARKPQRRSQIEPVERGSIRDRFNYPLSQNKIDYAVAVRYADIRDIPAYRWKVNDEGKKVKEPVRGPYITSLAKLLGEELNMDPEEIEDTIHAKATLFPHTPFIIKESLNERQYYKIRALEKDWVGIEAKQRSKRVYPQGKTACDVVGYMGAISSCEYLRIAEEIKELEQYIKKREAGEIVFLPKGYNDPLEVRKRLTQLKEKAYTINDLVGKTGIEGSCDELLRGIHGKKTLEIDPKGNVLRELPGAKKGVNGQRIFLSISSELQEFAEALLAENEKIRDIKDKDGKTLPGAPWIKGGAIVAFDPQTGEVLTLASYPRFDPNDFVKAKNPEQQKSVRRWIESEGHIAEIWEGKTKLKREIYSFKEGWVEESLFFTWPYFLSTIIPSTSPISTALKKVRTMENALLVETSFESLIEALDFKEPAAIIQTLYQEHPHVSCKKKFSADLLSFLQNKLQAPELAPIVSTLEAFLSEIPYNDDKLLALDIIRLLIVKEAWTPDILSKLGHLSLDDFFQLTQSLNIIQEEVKEKAKALHHQLGFKEWREKYFKSFLKKKRQEEKEAKKYAKPYTEYLEKVEKALFKSFWNTFKYLFLDAAIYGKTRLTLEDYPTLQPYLDALEKNHKPFLIPHIHKLQKALASLSPVETSQYLKGMRSFEELERPLYGKYRLLRNTKGVQLEKHLAGAFYPLVGFGYGRSLAFRQSTPLGSVFKLTIAYEALRERYEYLKENGMNLKDLNPLTLIDELQVNIRPGSPKQILGYMLDGQPIKRLHKGAILPRSSHAGIGKVDLTQAIEQSSNIYFSILAAEHVAEPSFLEKATKEFGFGSKTGIDLQGEIPGNIPDDLADNKTGLYAFAIGQHALSGTPLQTAVMLSSLGNGGNILKPRIVCLTAGKDRADDPFSFDPEKNFPFQEPLSLIGINFPLFNESLLPAYNPLVNEKCAEIKRSIFLPNEIKHLLFSGMDKVVRGTRGTARAPIIRYLKGKPAITEDYIRLQGQLLGKTGTAEIDYKPWLDSASKAKIHNHVSFSGLVFPEGENPEQAKAELAIVVYLRFSEAGGKEAAPLASQIAKKWREIQKKEKGKSYLR